MEVTIRPLRVEDAYKSVDWRNDPEVFKYTGNTYNHTIDINTELDWIKRIIEIESDYRCAIEVDGVYVGNIYLTNISDGSAEYHIFIGEKKYWGKGIAREASLQIIDIGFTRFQLNKIYLKVNRANIGAHSLYLALGFQNKSIEGNWINMELTNER